MYKLANKNIKSGMTLVELLVVLGIFVMVSLLVIFNYGSFRSSVSLQNLSDDIALSVRRAQNYAIGVRGSQSSFTSGYGIHFSTAAPNASDARAGSNKTFILFNDLNPNKVYNYLTSSSTTCNSSTLSSSDECIDMLTITTSDVISSLCPYSGGTCTNMTNAYADITFLRPNPDAYICVGTLGSGCSQYSSIDIIITNPESKLSKTITISNVGQISIK